LIFNSNLLMVALSGFHLDSEHPTFAVKMKIRDRINDIFM